MTLSKVTIPPPNKEVGIKKEEEQGRKRKGNGNGEEEEERK